MAESVRYTGKGGPGDDWRDHRDYLAESIGYRGEGRRKKEKEKDEATVSKI